MLLSRYSLPGIGARVNMVFAAISSIMLFVMVLSWLAFEELGAQLIEINEVRVPSLSKTINLFSIADDFIITGPQLGEAQTDRERQAIYSRMSDYLDRLSKINNIQNVNDGTSSPHQRIQALTENLHTSLTHLNTLAQYRLRLQRLKVEKEIDLNRTYSEIQQLITNIVTLSNHSNLPQSILRAERLSRDFYDNLLYLSEVKTIPELKQEISNLSQQKQIFMVEASGLTPELDNAILRFTSQLDGDDNLTALYSKLIENKKSTKHELEKARVKIVQLRLILTLNMKSTQQAIATATDEARHLISSRTTQLALSVATVVVLSFVASLIFVRRSLVRRLTQLGSKMKLIAEGELDTVIDTSGNDEITRMAEALEVFRKTAREVEEQQIRAIIESSVAGLIMTNSDGDIEFLSHTARTLFGYDEASNSELPKLKINELVINEQGNLLLAMLDDCRELQDKGHAPPLSSHVQEFNSRRYDGSTFPSDIAVRGVQQRRGKKFIFTIYDVTERKNAQEILEHTVTQRTAELSQINEELKLENKVRIHTEKALRSTKKELIQASKLAALGKMASGISHEFNQPLMAVSSWLHNIGLLLDQGHRNEAEEALANIGTQVNRMIELASHIQTLARQPDLMFSPTDVCEVLERSLTLFQVRISQEGATVNRSHVAQPLIISTDGLRLEQVFINLVSNALDAMGSQDNKIITIDAGFDQNEKLSIRLSDSGPGIPEDIREHVFDPFFTTKKTGKGMGLGLSISYNIVHSLGGSLAVHNLESGGACFVLTLPIDGVNSQTPIQAEGIW